MQIECSTKFIADSSRNFIIIAESVNVNMIIINITIIRNEKKIRNRLLLRQVHVARTCCEKMQIV